MLVLPVPRSPLHRLRVDERRDVVGANSRRAALTDFLGLGYLGYRFRDAVPLGDISSSVPVIPLADLDRIGKPFQRHADRTRKMSGPRSS